MPWEEAKEDSICACNNVFQHKRSTLRKGPGMQNTAAPKSCRFPLIKFGSPKITFFPFRPALYYFSYPFFILIFSLLCVLFCLSSPSPLFCSHFLWRRYFILDIRYDYYFIHFILSKKESKNEKGVGGEKKKRTAVHSCIGVLDTGAKAWLALN